MSKHKFKKSSKEKSLSVISAETVEPIARTPDQYICFGNFLLDYTELCTANKIGYIPHIVPRPRPLGNALIQPIISDSKVEKGKGSTRERHFHHPPLELDSEMEVGKDTELKDQPPKTYTTKDKSEYFMPHIEVEMETAEKYETVSEVYIRGWKIDAFMMNILCSCWIPLEKLHTIDLWNTGLTEQTISLLGAFLNICTNVRNLAVNNNHVKEENYNELMQNSIIQNLSLRDCGITDKGAEKIGKALNENKSSKLMCLDLAGNKIGNKGGEHLSKGLRLNRKLLVLCLASNYIGDKAAILFAETLSHFSLTHEEIVERRQLRILRHSPPPSRYGDRPGSVRSTIISEKERSFKKEKTWKKKDSKLKEDGRSRKDKDDKGKKGSTMRISAVASYNETKSGGKGRDRKGMRSRQAVTSDQEVVDIIELVSPLMEPVEEIKGELWLNGNRTLISLNLARNQIGEAGISALYKAVQYQDKISKKHEEEIKYAEETTLKIEEQSTKKSDTKIEMKPTGTGLMRLVVTKNYLPDDHEIMIKLNELLLPKDPFYKTPDN